MSGTGEFLIGNLLESKHEKLSPGALMRVRTKIIVGSLGAVAVIILIVIMVFFMTIAAPPSRSRHSVKPPKDQLGAIDGMLEKLAVGNIAFNAPQTMNLHNTALIQLKLGLTTPTEELKRLIEAEGEKEGARIQVSDRMEARLTGPNFAISAITPETQAVSRSAITEWKWEVKPNSGGRQNLHLTLSAVLSIDGAPTPRVIRTFDRIIEIEVTWDQRVRSFVENNWQWLWAAIIIPLFGWFWKIRKRLN
jgi:hypothetical protein